MHSPCLFNRYYVVSFVAGSFLRYGISRFYHSICPHCELFAVSINITNPASFSYLQQAYIREKPPRQREFSSTLDLVNADCLALAVLE
jgi:hypothetical protein